MQEVKLNFTADDIVKDFMTRIRKSAIQLLEGKRAVLDKEEEAKEIGREQVCFLYSKKNPPVLKQLLEKYFLPAARERIRENKQGYKPSDFSYKIIRNEYPGHITWEIKLWNSLLKCSENVNFILYHFHYEMIVNGAGRAIQDAYPKMTDASLTRDELLEAQSFIKEVETQHLIETLRKSLDECKEKNKSLEEKIKRLKKEKEEEIEYIKEKLDNDKEEIGERNEEIEELEIIIRKIIPDELRTKLTEENRLTPDEEEVLIDILNDDEDEDDEDED